MSKYASVKRRTKDAKAPSPSTLIHNARLDKNIEYLLPQHLRLKNYHMTSISNATKTFNTWKKENEDRYQKLNGRKLRNDAHKLESILIILSEDQVNKCNPNDVWKKAELFKDWFEMKYETIVRTMDWHRDEGHSDEDENDEHKLETRNNHIHLEFDNVNNKGKMVRRLFSKGDLKIFQDKIAEIYEPLGFVRGKDTAKKHRNDKPKRGIGQEAFRSKKRVENREKNIKKEMKLLGEELQKWEAQEPHYAKLAEVQKQLQKELLEQKINYEEAIKKIKEESQKIIDELRSNVMEQNKTIEEKNIHITSDATKIQEIQQKHNNLESDTLKTASQHMLEIKELQDKNNKQEISVNNLIEQKDQKINALQGDISLHKIIDVQKADSVKILNIQIEKYQKVIEDKNAQIDSGTKVLKDNQEVIQKKDNEIHSLNEQVQELEKDVFSETWTQTANNGKKYKYKNIDVVKHLNTKNKELKVQIETLEKQNCTLTTTLEQKDTQISSNSNILKKNQEKIKVLGKQVQEFQDKEPEKIEVIKEVPRELTQEEIMQLEIRTEQGSILVDDIITKLQAENKKLQKELDKKPTQALMEQDAMYIAYLMDENEKLQELAYFNDLVYDHEAQEPFSVEKSYKSVVEHYRTQMSENNKNLSQIEITFFDSNKKRDTEVIVGEAQRLKNNYSNMKKIFSNASKYLHLTSEKFVELFENDVPSKNKVSLSEIVKIKKEVPNTTSTSCKMGR